ncbi:expressed unknown protein [Seminavis robusta]|uniref:Uncharacterized protein n=1 Tax=Seminavis robusta TaxID=568900 RepID=A0A9N8E787_9STRA|nr:expressed unknown protein [Seminavis robusta]|eukprot:Sro570_g168490.1 n/a (608) ;mRNA; f:17483-19306
MEDQSTPGGPSSSSVCGINSSSAKKRAAVGEMAEEAPCVKKPKLTRKELLEQAKARLKEAQEKKKMLQLQLEEEQAEQAAAFSMDEDYFYYDYEYEYHIPPVTGSTDSLLITHIESTGPTEKVRFKIEDENSCIEAVMKVITNRRRTLSPSNNNNNAANPQGPPQKTIPNFPPPRETVNKPNTSEGSTTSSNNANHTNTNADTNSKPAALNEGLKSQRPTHFHKRTNSSSNVDQQPTHPTANPAAERRHSHTQTTRQMPSNNNNANNPRTNRPQPPLLDKPKENPRRNSSGPLQLLQQQQQTSQQRPPPVPTKRPWKLALAQVTGKTCDFTPDLPTKTAYLIRTQDQGVVAHVQFFSSPDNPALLAHQPSKRHLQDHYVPIGRLPSNNSSQSWKGQEILSFLKHQDERRKTYQPPARRNLPLTHWAIIDLEQPLHQAIESSGYFTAAPAAKNGNGNNSSSNNNDIGFAGKLIWNLHDFYQQRNNNNNNAAPPPSKLSKWGEVVSAVATSGARNSPLIATVQGFYESPPNKQGQPEQPVMPHALRARKVILPKSRTIGIIIGSNARMSEQQNNNNPQVGCCQVLFPNGMASGPPSAQSLKGARAILYD